MSYPYPTLVDLRGRPGATGLAIGYRLDGTAGGSPAGLSWVAAFAESTTQPGLYLPTGPGRTIALPDGFSGVVLYGTNPATPGPAVDVAAEAVGPGTYELASKLVAPGGSAPPVDVNVVALAGNTEAPGKLSEQVLAPAQDALDAIKSAVWSADSRALTPDGLDAIPNTPAAQGQPATFPEMLADLHDAGYGKVEWDMEANTVTYYNRDNTTIRRVHPLTMVGNLRTQGAAQ